MRRSAISIAALALPLTVASLSLATFQPIDSPLIPSACLREYNSEIAICTTDDFNIGCISRCKTALSVKEQSVASACTGLIVNSKSLLGIVKDGQLVEKLCLKDRNDPTATTSAAPSFISIVTSRTSQTSTSTRAPVVVAPPTTTSSTAPAQTLTQSRQTSTTTTLSDQIIVAPTTSLSPSGGDDGDDPTLTRSSARPTNTPAVGVAPGNSGNGNNNNNGLNGSGGGSPFDVVAAAGSSLGQSSSLGALIVAIWAVMLVAR